MADLRTVDDERTAAALADLLNGNSRRRPVVVVTTPAGRSEPWIDVEEITREAGALADVYLMPTGPATWEFSHRMADGTQVYGGAGRVYPVGHEWASDLSASPLRFAFHADDGQRAGRHLVSDMLRMAAAAGLLAQSPPGGAWEVTGIVMMTVAGRALVDVGRGFPAAVAQELTVEDVPIDRIVAVGQQIGGLYDPETNRVDLRKQIRSGIDALGAYEVGDVILTQVSQVRSDEAELLLYPATATPAVVVTVTSAEVTSHPADDLRTLMTRGEVLAARIVATGPGWALTLSDVDDDEPVVDPPSLIHGGPPWLVHDLEALPLDEGQPLAPPAPSPVSPLLEPAPAPAPENRAGTTAAAARPRPTPALFDKHRPRAAPAQAPDTHSTGATQSLLRKIDGLTAEVARVERGAALVRGQLLAAADEREQLRYLLDQAERNARRAENDLKAARARLRKAGNHRSAPATDEPPQFADAEQGFRYLVLTRWATRTMPSEQRDRPLGDYVVGTRFLRSLESLEGIKREKVADVVFEIVTGLAPQLPSRETHRLRTGTGGDDPVRTREDGATAWRASLQVNTPSARRIHYWVHRSGRIELARVAVHDDFDV